MMEVDVREDILAPLLTRLGWRVGGEGDIQREFTLQYPALQIGHRKPRDLPLSTGRLDYQMTAESSRGKLRWILEAKAAKEELDHATMIQAYSYAIHSEVGACLYAVSNGRFLTIYDSTSVPTLDNIIYHKPFEVWRNGSDPALNDLLEVDNFRSRFERLLVGRGEPLGGGLASEMKITGGSICYTACTSEAAAELLVGKIIPIGSGRIYRGESGTIEAEYTIVPGDTISRDLFDRYGLNQFHLVSRASRLPSDTEGTADFIMQNVIAFPAGEIVSMGDLRPRVVSESSSAKQVMLARVRLVRGLRLIGSVLVQVWSEKFDQDGQSLGPPAIIEVVGEVDINLSWP